MWGRAIPSCGRSAGLARRPAETREERMLAKACAGLLASACALLLAGAAACAQDFPSKPVRLIVPFAAGGPVGVLARALGGGFKERTGQVFIVDNNPRGNTALRASPCNNAQA